MGTDNKEVVWILLDENTKLIRISFDMVSSLMARFNILLEERNKLCIQMLNLKPHTVVFLSGHK